METKILLLVLLSVLYSCTEARQLVPFDPIHPGTLHADHFSPLTGDQVSMPDFLVDKFNSGMLDFASLNSETRVQLDLPGGLHFNNENLQISGAGSISISSDVNNINIQAPRGEAHFHGNTLDVSSTGGDILFQSFEENVFIAAGVGSVNFNAPGWNAISQYSNTTISIHAEGEFSISTGGDFLNGNVNFEAGSDLYLSSDSTNFLTQSSIAFHALDQLGFIVDGDIDISAAGSLDLLTQSGFFNVEATAVEAQAAIFKISSQGATSLKSVLGRVLVDSGFTNIVALDQVRFGSSQDGVFLTANNNVFFTIGNAIRWTSSEDFNIGQLNAVNLNLQSDKGGVNWNAFDDIEFTVEDDVNINAGNNFYANGQGVMAWESVFNTDLQAGREFVFSAIDLLTVDAGSILYNNNNNQYILVSDYAEFSAPTINFNIKSTAALDLNTNEFDMIAATTIAFAFDNNGLIYGTDSIYLESQGALTYNTNRVTVHSTDSVYVQAGSNLAVTTNGGDVNVASPTSGRYLSHNLVISSNIGTSDANFISNSAQGTKLTASTRADWNAGDDLKVSAGTEMAFTFASQSYSSTGGAVELQSDSAAFYNVENTLTYKTTFGDISFGAVDMQIQAGDFVADGPVLSVTIPDSGWLSTRTGRVNAASGPITMTIGQDGDFDSRGVLNVHSDSMTTFLADNMIIEASDFFQGDITFEAGSNSITITTNNFQAAADGLSFSSGGSTIIRSNNFLMDHKTLQDLSKDYGDVQFDADQNFQQVTQFTISHNQRDGEYSGDASVGVSATNQLQINTQNSADFQAERNVQWLSNTLTVASTNITISGVESALFNTNTALSLDTAGLSTVSTSNDASFTSILSLEFSTPQGTEVNAEDNILIQGSPLRIQSTTLSYYETSGGGTFDSGLSTTFTAREYLQAQAEDLLTVESQALTVTATAVNGDLHVLGGEVHGVAAAQISFLASGFFNGLANDYGSVIFDAGQSFVQTTGQFNWYGQAPDAVSTNGRYGTILAKADNVCFNSDFRNAAAADAPNSATNFIGDSVVASANGPVGTMVWNATSDILTESEESIGITAYGWILDPEFILDDDDVPIEVDDVDTYGVLFRADIGQISLDSVNSGLNAFSSQNFTAFSEFGGLSSVTGEILDFRTFDFDSNIYFTATNGNIELSAQRAYTITAGNSELPADLAINATRNILFDSNRGATWSNLGTSTVTDNLGIFIEAYGEAQFVPAVDFKADALLGGTLYVESRDGKISSTSSTGNARFIARTGSVNMQARGDASFVSDTDIIAIQAGGKGGSVFISSGADEDTTITAGIGHIFVDSLQGEVDLNANDGIIATVASDFNLQGPCVGLKGGNIENNANAIAFVTDQHISFAANVELTMDAAAISLKSEASPLTFNAGGDGVQAGLSMSAVGNIQFDSATGSQTWEAVNYVATSGSTIDFVSQGDVNIVSSLDSSAQDNVLIQSQNVEVSFTADRIDKYGSLLSSTKSLSLGVENAENVFFLAERELRFEFQQDFTQNTDTGFLSVLAGNMQSIISGSASFTSTTGSLGFTADQSFSIDVAQATSWTSLNTNIVSEAFNSAINFHSNSNTFTLTGAFTINSKIVSVVGSEDGVTLETNGLLSASSAADLNFIAVNTLNFQTVDLTMSSNEFLVEVGKSFTADSQVDVSFEASNLLVTAFGDITMTGVLTTITPAASQPVEISAENNINIRATNDVTFTGARLNFNAHEQLQSPAISLDSPLIDATVNRLSVTSKADISYKAGTTLTVNAPSSIFQSTGPNGILLDNAALDFQAGNNFNLFANRGNVFLNSGNTLGLTAEGINITTAHEFGAINLVLENTAALHSFSAQNLFFQSIGDFTRFKNGYIHAESFATTFNTPVLNLISDDDVQLFAQSTIDFSGTNLALTVGNLAKFNARDSIDITAIGTTEISTSRLSTINNQDVNAIHFNTDVYSSTQATSCVYTITEDINIHSQAYIDLAFDLGDFIAPSQSFNSVSGDLVFSVGGDLGLLASNLYIKGVSADSTSVFQGTTLVMTAGTFADFEADNAIWMPANDIQLADDLLVRSAGGVWIEAADILVTSPEILFEATADGIIDVKAYGQITITATGLSLRAEGDLGSQGGRYVLEDFYNEAAPMDRNHRINVNTNAMEFTAVNGGFTGFATGTMSFTARHGSIEARCPRIMRYSTVHNLNAGPNIFFYGLNDVGQALAPPVPGDLALLAPLGVHRSIPYTFSTDYCASPAGLDYCSPDCSIECTELSSIINQITRMLVAYGFLECSTPGAGFCLFNTV